MCLGSLKKTKGHLYQMPFLVTRIGFEPMTHSLEGCCSIQLSYRASYYAARKYFKKKFCPNPARQSGFGHLAKW